MVAPTTAAIQQGTRRSPVRPRTPFRPVANSRLAHGRSFVAPWTLLFFGLHRLGWALAKILALQGRFGGDPCVLACCPAHQLPILP